MVAFDFDSKTRSYSARNAYWLGKAADLAYQSSASIKAEAESWGLRDVEYFKNCETQAFLAGNDETLILAFRGTEPNKLKDWMTDLDIGLVGGPGGKVHEGFNTALNAVWRNLLSTITTKRKRRSLWVTGHSLGAALATLAVAKLRLERDEPVNGLYTFGQPRTGNSEFAQNFNADFAKQTFHHVNNNDIVPRVPFRSMTYSHVGTFKYFDVDQNLHDDDIMWWEKLLNRLKGRIEDFLVLGTDGINDHAMTNYIAGLQKAKDAVGG